MKNEYRQITYNEKIYTIYISYDENNLPYVLVYPEGLEAGKELVVESLNLGGNISTIDKSVENRVKETLGRLLMSFDRAPILIPIVPSVENDIPYYQQLSKECFSRDLEGIREYERIDLKCLEVIKEARRIIEEKKNIRLNDKIFLNGYSTSGVFAQRFALIHPEIVDKCCVGGAVGSIPIPECDIGYPIGIQDFEDLFGKKFNEKVYREIDFVYYVAQNEASRAGNWDIDAIHIARNLEGRQINRKQIPAPMHDMSYHGTSIPRDIGKIQRFLFGEDLETRFKKAMEYYTKKGYKIKSKIYKGTNHRFIYSENGNPYLGYLFSDLKNFYENNVAFEQDISSCTKLDMSFQLRREGKIEKEHDEE